MCYNNMNIVYLLNFNYYIIVLKRFGEGNVGGFRRERDCKKIKVLCGERNFFYILYFFVLMIFYLKFINF